jgi:inosose dehydratase
MSERSHAPSDDTASVSEMNLAYHTITWGGVIGHPAGVTDVKELYYLASGSTEQALADIGQAGYAGCELFDGNIVAYADQINTLGALLDAHALSLVAVYCGANFIFSEILDEELSRIDRAAALAAGLGAEQLVLGGGARRSAGESAGDLQRLAVGLARAGEIARRYELTPSYHPHLGTIVQTSEALDEIMQRTEMGLCPDTGHLAAMGIDPAAVIRRYRDRLPYVHLKGWSSASQKFMPLDEGDLDLEDTLAALAEVDYRGWITVELDAWDGDPAQAARRSAGYLRHMR